MMMNPSIKIGGSFVNETITDQLKSISQVIHARYRNMGDFLFSLLAGLIAYAHQPRTSSLNLRDTLLVLLPATLI